jgi:exopolyphosphatase/guanosine-5'-triphosphate,3'-diphosphate pyrophosphatase
MIPPAIAAVIEIGSTGIRLLVAEYEGAGLRVLDQALKPVALGRDVFGSGAVSRESFQECLSALQSFREQLGGWALSGTAVHIIATSAIRAARNRDMFTDRLTRETGFAVTVIEGIEENRLMYLALRFALKNDVPPFWQNNSMILDVGGGSTEIMLLRRGKMAAAHSLRLGSVLMDHRLRQGMGSAAFIERFLRESVRSAQDFLNDEMDLSGVRRLAATGSDLRQAAAHIGRELNGFCRIIGKPDFLNFVKSVENLSAEECARRYAIPFADAEGFVPGLLIYRAFLERTAAEELIVPNISVREGYLIDRAAGVDAALEEDFYSQIIASAVNLGRKYRFDEAHNRHVAALCLVLFDALAKEHGMSGRQRMMLEVAATLHDIGMFIRGSGHHKHGQYIIVNSEIFGLRREELDIIGAVVSCHRDIILPGGGNGADIGYLPRGDRVLVFKMAALLRVADALDRSHSQRIKNISVEKKTGTLIIHSDDQAAAGQEETAQTQTQVQTMDRSLEELSLREKADLFEDVFGCKVILN